MLAAEPLILSHRPTITGGGAAMPDPTGTAPLPILHHFHPFAAMNRFSAARLACIACSPIAADPASSKPWIAPG